LERSYGAQTPVAESFRLLAAVVEASPVAASTVLFSAETDDTGDKKSWEKEVF
jgi:hypothetical protein